MAAPFHTVTERFAPYAAVPIRLLIGHRLVYGTQDNVFSRERMVEFAGFSWSRTGFPCRSCRRTSRRTRSSSAGS